MTNGLVAVLGSCGRNFAAGMSGGIAYVFDDKGDFTAERCNTASVDLEAVTEDDDLKVLRGLVLKHAALTASPRARWILQNWARLLPKFVKVFPHEFKRTLGVPRVVERYMPVAQPTLTQAEAQHG
jgi:glutamate synthase domain-containing protein 3